MTTKHIGMSIVGLGLYRSLEQLKLNARQNKKIDHKTVYLLSKYCSNLRYVLLA